MPPTVAIPVVNKFAPKTLPVAFILLLEPIFPVAKIKPLVSILAPTIFPLTLNKPVTNSPVVANTATLLVPPTLTVTLLPEPTTRTFELPFCMLVASIPESWLPLPKIYPPEILAVVVIFDVEFRADMTFELKLNTAAFKLPPVILPLALITPVMYAPVVENTATFDVPPIVIFALPLGV